MNNLGDRSKYIGSSDIASILGISPFKSRTQLLREKITGVESTFDSPAMRFGREHEKTLLFADSLVCGYDIIPEPPEGQHEVRGEIDGFPLIGHLDGRIIQNSEKYIAEVKTTSKMFSELPAYYACQVAFDCHLDKTREARIIVGERLPDKTLGRTDAFWHEPKPEEWDIIEKAIREFIADIRKGELPPDNDLPAPIEHTAIEQFNNAMAQLEQAEAFIETFKTTLKEKMADFGLKSCVAGKYKITLTEPTTKIIFDSTRLKKEKPELFDEYEKESPVSAGIRITKLKG